MQHIKILKMKLLQWFLFIRGVWNSLHVLHHEGPLDQLPSSNYLLISPFKSQKVNVFTESLYLVTFLLGQSFLFFKNFQQSPFTTWYECFCTNLYLNIWPSKYDYEYLQGIYSIWLSINLRFAKAIFLFTFLGPFYPNLWM